MNKCLADLCCVNCNATAIVNLKKDKLCIFSVRSFTTIATYELQNAEEDIFRILYFALSISSRDGHILILVCPRD